MNLFIPLRTTLDLKQLCPSAVLFRAQKRASFCFSGTQVDAADFDFQDGTPDISYAPSNTILRD